MSDARRQLPAQPDPMLEELYAWALSRALPEIEDKWDEGYESLRTKLLAWIAERRGEAGSA